MGEALVTIPTDDLDLTLLGERPVDGSPAAVYLSGFSSGPQRTLRAALNVIAHAACGLPRQIQPVSGSTRRRVETTYLAFPWERLRYAHTRAIRAWLVQRVEQKAQHQEIVDAAGEPLPAYSVARANTILAALRGVLKTAWEMDLLPTDAYLRARNVKDLKAETLPSGRALDTTEVARLLSSCVRDAAAYRADPTRLAGDVRDAALIAVLYATGLRRFEVVALDLADYIADRGELWVRVAKNRAARIAYLADGATAALDDWLVVRGGAAGPLFCGITKAGKLSAKRLTDQAVYHILQQRQQQSGVAPFSPHDLRRTCVGDLLAAGVDLNVVRQLVGHRTVTTTARYDRRGETTKREAALRLQVLYQRRSLFAELPHQQQEATES